MSSGRRLRREAASACSLASIVEALRGQLRSGPAGGVDQLGARRVLVGGQAWPGRGDLERRAVPAAHREIEAGERGLGGVLGAHQGGPRARDLGAGLRHLDRRAAARGDEPRGLIEAPRLADQRVARDLDQPPARDRLVVRGLDRVDDVEPIARERRVPGPRGRARRVDRRGGLAEVVEQPAGVDRGPRGRGRARERADFVAGRHRRARRQARPARGGGLVDARGARVVAGALTAQPGAGREAARDRRIEGEHRPRVDRRRIVGVRAPGASGASAAIAANTSAWGFMLRTSGR